MTIEDTIRQLLREELERHEERIANRIAEHQRERLDGNIGGGGRVLSTKQAAALAGVNADTIRRWLTNGKLPGKRAGRHWRILDVDLMAFLAAGAQSNGEVDINERANEILRQVSAASQLSDESATMK